MFFRAIYLNKTTVLIGQSEGLPNITGSMIIHDPVVGGLYRFSGAFIESGTYHRAYFGSHEYDANYEAGFKFDASLSNPIYGNNAHVTPTNATIKIWQRIS